MRTLTDEQLRAYASGCQYIVRVTIEDENGVARNWTDADGNGLCFISKLSWGEDDDSPMMSGEADVYWHHTQWTNLSPFNTANSRYAGWMHDGWPVMVVSSKTVPQGADPDDYDWFEEFEARVDNFDLSQHPGKIQFRERVAAELMDDWITANTRFGANDGSKDVEDVMTDIITEFDTYSPQHTIEVPVATSLQVKKYNQAKQPILLALRVFALQLGWDLRTKWHAASSSWRMTLYEPDRSTTTVVHTFPADAIRSYGEFSYSIEYVRNAVQVFFGKAAELDDLGNDLRTSVIRTAETSPAHDLDGIPVAGSSIAKRGWRYMEFAEGATSLVQTQAQAEAMADAAIADLADPTVLMGCRLGYVFGAVELNDFIRLEADGIRFGSDFDLAVRGYRHHVSGRDCYTELTLQGKPGLGRGVWTSVEARPGKAAPPDDLAPEAPQVSSQVGAFGVKITVAIPPDRDYDQVLFYRGETSDFTPDASNLVQSGRQLSFVDPPQPQGTTRYYKCKYRDIHGNYSDVSTASDVVYTALTITDYIEPMQSLPLGTMSAQSLITVEDADGNTGAVTLGSLLGLDPVLCSYSRAASVDHNGTPANSSLIATANFSDGETVEVGGKTYTFKATLTDVDGYVLIGADEIASRSNLAAAINLDDGAGTKYAASTTANPEPVEALSFSGGLGVFATGQGTAGNSITVSEACANASWSNTPTLSGGTDSTLETVIEIPWLPVWDAAQYAFFLVRCTDAVESFEISIEVDGAEVFSTSHITLGTPPIYPDLQKIVVPITGEPGWTETDTWVAQLKARVIKGAGNLEIEGWGLLREALPMDYVESATFEVEATLAATETYVAGTVIAPQFSGVTSYNWSAKDFEGDADGTGVTSWTDRHSGIEATAPTGATKQTVSGEPVLRFAGSSDNQKFTAAGATFTSNGPATLFVVCKWDSGAAQGGVLDGLSGTTRNVIYNQSGSLLTFFAGGNLATAIDPRGSFHRIRALRKDTNANQMWLDGTSVAGPGAAGLYEMTAGVTLGGYYNPGNRFDGDVCEYVLYDGELDSTQMAEVETYLASEWAAVL